VFFFISLARYVFRFVVSYVCVGLFRYIVVRSFFIGIYVFLYLCMHVCMFVFSGFFMYVSIHLFM